MSYPPFIWKNPATIGWSIRDNAGVPVQGATVTATLYASRDFDNPDTTPGTAVTSMQNIVLVDQSTADPPLLGFYKADIQASAIPAISDDYVLVVDAVQVSTNIGHWEETTAVLVRQPLNPDLCLLGQVKDFLNVDESDTSQDKQFKRWISSCSADFLKRIRRPGFFPTNDYNELIQVTNWQTDSRLKDIFVSHYPLNSVTSVTINDIVLPEYDPNNPQVLGWVFDPTLPDEDRQYFTLRGLYWPIFETWLSPRRPIYRPAPLRINVVYNGGYSDVPNDVQEAIVEWVGFKKGLRELQAHDQTEQWMQLGQYQQNNMIATSTLKMSDVDMPDSVAQVINAYQMPVAP